MIDRVRSPYRTPEPPTTDEHAPRPLEYTLAGVFLFAVAVYAKFPTLDLIVSSRQYHPVHGFVGAHAPLLEAMHLWAPRLGLGVVALLLSWLVVAPLVAWWAQRRSQGRWLERAHPFLQRSAVLALLVALVGPGLLSEGLFKNTVGRPRPVQIEPFGGPAAFQGPFQIGDNPSEHRSFVSSTAATGFALMGLGLACGPTWRRRWLIIGIVAGSVLGLGRILQGAHFLSDVVFAFYTVWWSTVLIGWAADKWFPPRPGP